jgi:hypothetical protein
MGKGQHNHGSTQYTANQNNEMSNDPKDGSRDSFVTGAEGKTPMEKKPPHDRQDRETIEAHGRAGSAKDG